MLTFEKNFITVCMIINILCIPTNAKKEETSKGYIIVNKIITIVPKKVLPVSKILAFGPTETRHCPRPEIRR